MVDCRTQRPETCGRLKVEPSRLSKRTARVPVASSTGGCEGSGGGSAGAVPALRRHLEASQPEVLISGPIIPNLAAVVAMGLARRWRGRLVLSHHHPVRLARHSGTR